MFSRGYSHIIWVLDAAALCGVAKQTFQSIEHRHGTSKLGTVLQICDSLGIN